MGAAMGQGTELGKAFYFGCDCCSDFSPHRKGSDASGIHHASTQGTDDQDQSIFTCMIVELCLRDIDTQ